MLWTEVMQPAFHEINVEYGGGMHSTQDRPLEAKLELAAELEPTLHDLLRRSLPAEAAFLATRCG